MKLVKDFLKFLIADELIIINSKGETLFNQYIDYEKSCFNVPKDILNKEVGFIYSPSYDKLGINLKE